MTLKPFLKWAGGKRWIVERDEFRIPPFSGKYIEPFLGGGAVFFYVAPKEAFLSDLNPRLIETYQAIKSDWKAVWQRLEEHQQKHSVDYYYAERGRTRKTPHTRAAQFLYLNRACWNGLYRENLRGKFNVPIGTKSTITFENDDFEAVALRLEGATLFCEDFETAIDRAKSGDLLFVDPPYTTAHNFNGFVKYNQTMFGWDDQIRLRDALVRAVSRSAKVVLTNAMHESVLKLYDGISTFVEVPRQTVISGWKKGRKSTSESLIFMGLS